MSMLFTCVASLFEQGIGHLHVSLWHLHRRMHTIPADRGVRIKLSGGAERCADQGTSCVFVSVAKVSREVEQNLDMSSGSAHADSKTVHVGNSKSDE